MMLIIAVRHFLPNARYSIRIPINGVSSWHANISMFSSFDFPLVSFTNT